MVMFHLSERAGVTRLKPSVPDGPEGDTPRVCVAPTILGCLRALGADTGQGYHVYLIEGQPDVGNREVCEYVSDAHWTGEHWFTQEVQCRWAGYVATVGVI